MLMQDLFSDARLQVREVLVVFGLIVIVGAVFFSWVTSSSPAELRMALVPIQFWILEFQFVALVVFSFFAIPRVVRILPVSRPQARMVAGIAAFVLLMNLLVVPRTNRIFYDEQIYQDIGRNMSDLHAAQMCNDGNLEYGSLICYRGEYNKQPYGYPYLLSVAYRIFGVSGGAAHIVNSVFVSLTVIIVFVGAILLGASAGASLIGGLVIATAPELIRWANTAAAEPSAMLLALMAFVAVLAFAKTRDTMVMVWTFTVTLFAAQIRPESLLIVLVVGATLLLFTPRALVERRFWVLSLLFTVAALPLLAHMVAVSGESWGAEGDRLSLSFILPNLKVNGLFYLANERFQVLVTLLAVVGILFSRKRRSVVALVTYFVFFFGVYLLFYAGSYEYGADVRYSLLTYPPLAMLVALGADFMKAKVRGLRLKWLAAALIVSFLWFIPDVRAVGEEAWGAREDVVFAREMAEQLPRNSYVLTHNPNMFHIWDVSAGQASLATEDEEYLRNELVTRYAGGLYFHWNYWCNVDDPIQVAYCESILSRYSHELMIERRVRGYRYAFYRLRPGGEDDAPRRLGAAGRGRAGIGR